MLSVSNATIAQQNAVPIDEVHFPDYGFRKWVSEHFTPEEIPQATVLRIQETGFSSYPIRSIEGIEYFANLEEMHFKNTSYLHVNNLSKNTKLKWFNSEDIAVDELNLSGCIELENVYLHSKKASELSFSPNKKLKSLVLRTCVKLTALEISDNIIKSFQRYRRLHRTYGLYLSFHSFIRHSTGCAAPSFSSLTP